MGDFVKMFSFLNDIGNYEERKLGNDTLGELVVSTAYTSDEGYETAIEVKGQFHPVERYETREDALAGHKEWCEKAPSLTEITDLGGMGGFVGPKTIKIK